MTEERDNSLGQERISQERADDARASKGGTRDPVRLSVIMPTVGRSERFGKTLASLLACEPLPDEIIVVDGEQSPDARAVAERFRSTHADRCAVRYIASPPGLTRQRNLGLAAANSDVVVFVDDDMNFAPTPDVFRQVSSGFLDPGVVGLTGRIVEDDQRRFGNRQSGMRRLLLGRVKAGTFSRFGYPRYLPDPAIAADVEYMSGGFLCARRELALELRFDENLHGYAVAEDEDFSYRLSRRGRIRYVPSIVLIHERYGPRNQRALSRSLVVNRAYLFRKNFEQTARARIEFAVFIMVLVGHRLVNGDWAGARGLVEGVQDVVLAESGR
jgi:glycosyltransferase involved in cell wall biosynthesis